jgi:hypothetical protein
LKVPEPIASPTNPGRTKKDLEIETWLILVDLRRAPQAALVSTNEFDLFIA